MFWVLARVGVKMSSCVSKRIFICTLAQRAFVDVEAENAIRTARIHIEGQPGYVCHNKGSIPKRIKINCTIDIRIILAPIDESIGFGRHLQNDAQSFSKFSSHRLFLTGRAGYRGVKAGVEGIEILAVQIVLNRPKSFPESLKMNNLPGAEKADRVSHFRNIFHNAQDVIVGASCFLLWCDLVRTT